ncbi:MAG: hypothetical protein MJA83_10960 [Gammaproteobacteria bacterium]|nr:hypothetical protein [Gammaproteobacteria bacterium]
MQEISLDELKPGDVLLSYGSGWLSWLIKNIDGGPDGLYSHAGWFNGEYALDATKSGVKWNKVESDLHEQKYVDVYRFYSDSEPDPGQPLGSPNWPVEPINDRAEYYVKRGTEFAYFQLVLLGLLIAVRNKPAPWYVRVARRFILGRTIKLLKKLLGMKNEAVVCSELVYRCFYEARSDPKHRYGLTIKGTLGSLPGAVAETAAFKTAAPASAPTPGTQEEELIRLFCQARQARCSDGGQDDNDKATLGVAEKRSAGLMAPNPFVTAEFVSPHDLQVSPNLRLVGRLKK